MSQDSTDPISFPRMPRNKSELLDRMQRYRAELEQTISPLSEAELIAPGPEGWSVKDHLAHIAAWNNKLLAVMRGRPPYEGLQVDADTYAHAGENGINDILFHRSQARPLAEVLAEFRLVHEATVDRVASLSQERLAGPYSPSDPDDARKLVEAIANNTYEHDLEHRVWIAAIVRTHEDQQPGAYA